ncbi:MAG TPA: glycine oxidase ThiO [Steroidobacteraceae bacterium]|nr:glycine oxidase ThiO [Steroidobacteraceae bacterium]
MRAIVLGAGVAGLTCAVELAERGVAVEVLERGERLGAACCSWYAGGMLAPWCERESTEAMVAALGEESLAWWPARFPGAVIRGSLVVAHGRDVGELRQFARRTERYQWLDESGIAALEPDLAGRFSHALYFPEEGHLDPRAALAALAARLEGLGAAIRFGADAAACGERAIAAQAAGGAVIDCRGLEARDVLQDLRGVKGEMLVVKLPDVSLSRPVRVLHPRVPVYIVPRGDGHYMIGATMIESDQPTRISARSMLELLGAAYALHPAFGEAEIVEIGTGVRPAFADNLPRVCRIGGTVYVNGLYRHGFLLAPALARQAAEQVLAAGHSAEVIHEDSRQRRLA